VYCSIIDQVLALVTFKSSFKEASQVRNILLLNLLHLSKQKLSISVFV